MDESLLPDIIEYCKRFESGSYANNVERYLHFLFLENQKFRESMEGRDRRLIELMKEIGELKRELGRKR